jgi:hypothetical protein
MILGSYIAGWISFFSLTMDEKDNLKMNGCSEM